MEGNVGGLGDAPGNKSLQQGISIKKYLLSIMAYFFLGYRLIVQRFLEVIDYRDSRLYKTIRREDKSLMIFM